MTGLFPVAPFRAHLIFACQADDNGDGDAYIDDVFTGHAVPPENCRFTYFSRQLSHELDELNESCELNESNELSEGEKWS